MTYHVVVLTAPGKPRLYVRDGAGLTPTPEAATPFTQAHAEWSAANVRANAAFFWLTAYTVTVEPVVVTFTRIAEYGDPSGPPVYQRFENDRMTGLVRTLPFGYCAECAAPTSAAQSCHCFDHDCVL